METMTGIGDYRGGLIQRIDGNVTQAPKVGIHANQKNVYAINAVNRMKILSSTEMRQEKAHIEKKVMQEFLSLHGYDLLDTVLGEGSYAKVKLGKVKESHLRNNPRVAGLVKKVAHKFVAIKMIDKRKAPRDFCSKFLPRELSALANIGYHPNVVQMYECFETPSYMLLVLEYCEKGDMLTYINEYNKNNKDKGINEKDSRRLFGQLCDGMSHLHERGVVHRDLKCENLLVDASGNLKISDFGFSTMLPTKRSMLQTPCGSYAYAAPELMLNQKYNGKQADVWSMGVILYAMINGHLPFSDQIIKDIEEKKRVHKLTCGKHISPEAVMMIRKVLKYDPRQRPTIQDIKDDPWMRGEKYRPGHRLYNQRQRMGRESLNPHMVMHLGGFTAPLIQHQSFPRDSATVTINSQPRETVTLKSRSAQSREAYRKAVTPRGGVSRFQSNRSPVPKLKAGRVQTAQPCPAPCSSSSKTTELPSAPVVYLGVEGKASKQMHRDKFPLILHRPAPGMTDNSPTADLEPSFKLSKSQSLAQH